MNPVRLRVVRIRIRIPFGGSLVSERWPIPARPTVSDSADGELAPHLTVCRSQGWQAMSVGVCSIELDYEAAARSRAQQRPVGSMPGGGDDAPRPTPSGPRAWCRARSCRAAGHLPGPRLPRAAPRPDAPIATTFVTGPDPGPPADPEDATRSCSRRRALPRPLSAGRLDPHLPTLRPTDRSESAGEPGPAVRPPPPQHRRAQPRHLYTRAVLPARWARPLRVLAGRRVVLQRPAHGHVDRVLRVRGHASAVRAVARGIAPPPRRSSSSSAATSSPTRTTPEPSTS